MKRIVNREISWLSFNGRVLQEADDDTTPLIERLKFLGIFSSNLDEFFRVRVATLKRLTRTDGRAKAVIGDKPAKILQEIQEIVLRQSDEFDRIYHEILDRLADAHVHFIDESQLNTGQERFVRAYFHEEVRPALIPIMLENIRQFPPLKDHAIYLAVRMSKTGKENKTRHTLIEVPSDILPRFIVLPGTGAELSIMLLDDIIRYGLGDIFSMFSYDRFEAYTIKLTRDAELDLDDDISVSFFDKISKGVKQRKRGTPVRFVYDSGIPTDFLSLLMRRLKLTNEDALIPGGRYHNFKDFMSFPHVGPDSFVDEPFPPIHHIGIPPGRSFFSILREKDILLHYPYHSFHHVIDLLREAAIDPKVTAIKMTLYRVAKNSKVINALINAVRNGKSVTVVLELQARFDEETNIYWADRLKEEGVHVIHGLPNFKVHAKLCLISRKEKGGIRLYTNVGTGNFHEGTARIYTDLALFTADTRITAEVSRVFDILENYYRGEKFKHLMVSPFFLRDRMTKLIKREISHAKAGKKAHIILKMNSLVDTVMIGLIYEAADAGVKIDLIVRGMCALVPGDKGAEKNITAISIVDRFLEHTRVFVFHNDGDEEYYISSADLMPRNLDRRVEVACPVFDPSIREEIRRLLDIQLRDNSRARIHNRALDNRYRRELGAPPIRTQSDTYAYIRAEHTVPPSPEGVVP